LHRSYPDTWVYKSGLTLYEGNTNVTVCNDAVNQDQCTTIRGGQFDPDQSSSAYYPAAGEVLLTEDAPAGTPVQDIITLGDDSIDQYTLGMPTVDFGDTRFAQNLLGLGSASTLLDGLKNAGDIASRSWSYYNGNSGTSGAAVDGQIIFGGYNDGRAATGNITRPLEPASVGCNSGMWLYVEDMLLSFSNGTMTSILDGAPLRACIHLQLEYIISLASDPFWHLFEEYTGSKSQGIVMSALHDRGSLYSPTDVSVSSVNLAIQY
jgi:hypothetical protein